MKDFGFNGRETVAIMGTHTLGQPHVENSLFRYKWVGEIKYYLPRIPKILVVNKWDLDVPDKNEDLLNDEIINKAAQDLRMDDMIKVSAKTGYNIEELIQKVGRLSKRRPKPRVSALCKTL